MPERTQAESTPLEPTYPERLAAVAAHLIRSGSLLGPLPLDLANVLAPESANHPSAESHEGRLRTLLDRGSLGFADLEQSILKHIEHHPRRQKELSSVAAYNPGKWLLERELSQRRSGVPLEQELAGRSSGESLVDPVRPRIPRAARRRRLRLR